MNLLKDQKDWVCKNVLDRKTGKQMPSFFYRRKKAPFVKLDSALSKKLAGYTLIEKDLRTVSAWTELIDKIKTRDLPNHPGWSLLSDDRDEDFLIKSLFVSSIVFYAKCFTKAEGRNIKLEKSNLPAEFHSSHDEIMDMRHNYAAHSGAKGLESVDVYLVMRPSKKHFEREPILMRNLLQPEVMYDLPNAEDGFSSLVDQASKYAIDKIDSLNDRLFKKEIRPKGMEYWYKRGKR